MHRRVNRKRLVIRVLSVALFWGTSMPRRVASQEPSREAILWQKTLTPAAKGSRISIPKSILRQVQADPENCGDLSKTELAKIDAFRFQRGGVTLIAVWGKSSCYCSPTGNCAFWAYRLSHKRYIQLLRTDMVREFGFLRSTAKGLPDLVLWSHDSAMRFPGLLWQFDGREYVAQCGWEIVTSYKELPNLATEPIGSRVENNTCTRRLLPHSVPASKD